MRKVCIIATKLFIGGFTSSMLNFINCTKNEIDYEILFLEPKSHQLPLHILNGIKYREVKLKKHRKILASAYYLTKLKLLRIKKWFKNNYKSTPLDLQDITILLKSHCQNWFPNMDLSEYDCVVSWEELLCNIFLAEKVTARYKVGYIHPDYKKAKFSRKEDFVVLAKLDRIVAISNNTKEVLCEVFPEFIDKIRYLNNPIDISKINNLSDEYEVNFDKNKINFVTVCRLDNKSKALFRLLEVIEKLNQNHNNFDFYIVGDGQDKGEMERIIAEKKLANVILVGYKTNPYPYIKNADCLVLQSYYEGKPVVVDESLVLNTPVLVTNYQSAKEQVGTDVGFVVDNTFEAICRQMTLILNDIQLLNEKKDNLKKMDKDYFSKVLNLKEVFFDENNV